MDRILFIKKFIDDALYNSDTISILNYVILHFMDGSPRLGIFRDLHTLLVCLWTVWTHKRPLVAFYGTRHKNGYYPNKTTVKCCNKICI